MKYVLLILAFVSITNLLASQENSPEERQGDSCLVVRNSKSNILIDQGAKIKVRIGKEKFKGTFKIMNDSVIIIGENELLLSDIDLIEKKNKGRTFALIMAHVPVTVTGIVLMYVGIRNNEPSLSIPGTIMITGGITSAMVLSIRGKRYKRNKCGKQNKINDIRKWQYSIGSY
ncbi:MAG: hypothetical protein ACI8ZM_004767 [Crocinitomix sp.]